MCSARHAECYHKINCAPIGTEIPGGMNEYDSGHFSRIDFSEIRFFRIPIPPKINFTELNVPKDNFTEYPYEQKLIFRIHFAEFYPSGVKSEKYLLKKFVCEETGNTVKKFRSDPEEPLNKLLIKEIDTSEQIL